MVEWKKLGEVEDNDILTLGRGQVISKNDMNDCPGDYPVYSSSSQNNGEIGRYGKYMFDDERITWSIDGGGKLFYRNGIKYSVTNVCGWLKVNDENKLNTKFLYYLLFEEWTNIKFDYNHKAHPSVIRNEYIIPVIPLSEQQRIVGILDTFTASIENLKEQIAQRRKQYEYYRDQLLDLEGKEGVEMKTLGELCEIKNGYTPSTKEPSYWENGTLPWFTLEDIRKNGRILKDAIKHITPLGVKRGGLFPKNSVIVSTTATIGEYALIETAFLCNQQITCISINDSYNNILLAKFLYHLSQRIGEWCKKNVNGGGSLLIVSTSKLNKFQIPLPPLSEQQRIVSILDTFEASIQNLEAQLEQREKQYEYYRNQLLTFE